MASLDIDLYCVSFLKAVSSLRPVSLISTHIGVRNVIMLDSVCVLSDVALTENLSPQFVQVMFFLTFLVFRVPLTMSMSFSWTCDRTLIISGF